jgi:hypothetical protein
MGMIGGFPGQRRVSVAVAGDRLDTADVISISCWAAGGYAKLRARWVDAPASTLAARSSAAPLDDHLVRAGLWFGGATATGWTLVACKSRSLRAP